MQLVEMGRIMDVEEYYTRSLVKKQREPFDDGVEMVHCLPKSYGWRQLKRISW